MRQALFGSGIVHVLLVAVLFVTRQVTSVSLPGSDVAPVTLVDPAALRAPSAPPPPAPEPPRAEEEDGIRLDRSKPKPRPKPEPKREEPKREEPRREEPPRETAPAAAPAVGATLPSAAVGSAGLRGDLGTDTDFAFAYYLALVRDRIAARWGPPAGLATGGRVVRSVVRFRIARDGRVAGVSLEQGSGLEPFDRSAVRAVALSDPLPPLPAGYPGRDLGVHFGFEWGTP